MLNNNPFRHEVPAYYGIPYTETFVTDDRIRLVREFGIDECRAVLALPHIQKTVRAAAERRLRKLGGAKHE